MAQGQERWGEPFCRSGFLLFCKLFSAGFFGVTKRPPKADYTKESQSTQRRKDLDGSQNKRGSFKFAREKNTRNCLRQFGVCDNYKEYAIEFQQPGGWVYNPSQLLSNRDYHNLFVSIHPSALRLKEE